MTLIKRSVMVGCTPLLLLTALSACAPLRRPVGGGAPAAGQSDTPGTEDRSRAAHPDPRFVYLLLKLDEQRLYMVSGDGNPEKPPEIESFPVASGRREYATPTGRFKVTDKVENPKQIPCEENDPSRDLRTGSRDPADPLGLRWIGFTSAYGWQIGFHGTPYPESPGNAVSHGCVRMGNDDVVKVYSRVIVGTVVIVQP